MHARPATSVYKPADTSTHMTIHVPVGTLWCLPAPEGTHTCTTDPLQT